MAQPPRPPAPHHHPPPHHHETPTEERRSLNLWLLFVVVLVLIAIAALALVLVLKDDDSSKTPTTTTTPQPTTPQGFAQVAFADWKANNRAAAAAVASPQAVTQLFSVAYAPVGGQDPWSFRGCVGAAGSTVCTYAGQGSAQLIFTVRNATGGQPIQVIEVRRT